MSVWMRHCWGLAVLAAVVGTTIGFPLGWIWMPLVQAIAVFPLFAACLKQGRWARAAGSIVVWSVATTAIVIVVSHRAPEWAGDRILLGPSYQEEMFHWVRTGVGTEGDIRLFLPQHALHFGLFAVATFLSAGFLGLVMGAALVNYMSYYVGTLLAHATAPAAVLLMAWPPWAIVRVIAFILAATAIASQSLRAAGASVDTRPFRRYSIAAAVLLLFDVLLKWLLAPVWQPILAGATSWT